jgi:plasmid stabilization system protein ParE
MSGYELHPEAYNDLEAIREYIAEDNPTAAARVIVDIFDAIRALVPFPRKAISASISLRARCVSGARGITSSLCVSGAAAVGGCRPARQPQPARSGCYSKGPGVSTD